MHSHQPVEVPGITPVEAADMIADGAILIDVREQNEWETERIPGAEFKPMSQINGWYADLPRDRTIIVQCNSGQRSAAIINALMTQAGFDNLLNLTGGIVGWKFQNQPIER
jgi:rhodanese-related sulfurtransferase